VEQVPLDFKGIFETKNHPRACGTSNNVSAESAPTFVKDTAAKTKKSKSRKF
jgi:hypothetical protein